MIHIASLQRNGFFQGELKGSKKWKELMKNARRFYREAILVNQNEEKEKVCYGLLVFYEHLRTSTNVYKRRRTSTNVYERRRTSTNFYERLDCILCGDLRIRAITHGVALPAIFVVPKISFAYCSMKVLRSLGGSSDASQRFTAF